MVFVTLIYEIPAPIIKQLAQWRNTLYKTIHTRIELIKCLLCRCIIKKNAMQIYDEPVIYDDDEKIVEIISKFPQFEQLDNMSLLKYIEQKTENSDFGTVLVFEDMVYSIYKFDKHLLEKEEDAGLIMIQSRKADAHKQINIWVHFKGLGMSFGESIFQNIVANLSGISAAARLFNR